MSVKITQFEAENVKRIKALTFTPAPVGLTVIGGRNNQGKTSSLDAIVWALGGDRYRPSQAQRRAPFSRLGSAWSCPTGSSWSGRARTAI